MKTKMSGKILLVFVLTSCTFSAFAQSSKELNKEIKVNHKYSVSIPVIILPQLVGQDWDDRVNTQHLEFHVKRNLDDKNIIGVKFATWRLFQPMGIVWWDGLKDKIDSESEFYPGHVHEAGIGITYQRMLWKGLFATVEVLPQYKTYRDLEDNKIGNGFKLYNSFHLGYHFSIGKKKRFFFEPQVHSQFWVFDTKAPDGFKQLDDKWRNYFLFEPNLYFGVNF